ncbi:MAG: TonB-dependent receptor [Bacteroidetes bacterium]|nr:TonB-dependent receptor [Bacteroidota bacterium]
MSLCFLITTFYLNAQQIRICSCKDSVRIPFATVLIKNDKISYGKTSNDEGIIPLQKFDDTTSYSVLVQCFGFEKFHQHMKGSEINALKTLCLKPGNINLDEVVITAQYEPTLAENSVQKMKVIDGEKIKQMGAVNLRDVLSNQLNVRLQQDNILGSSMSLQGISGENVKFLIDGVPMIGRLNGSIDLSQINMNNVERIEFIEGPLSVQYGTNALAGTINIITKKNSGKKYTAGVTSYYESIGTYNLTGEVGFSRKKHSLQVSGGRNYFDGWHPREAAFYFPKPHFADSTRYKQWKPKEQYFATAAYQYSFKKLSLGLKSSYFDEVIINRGYPRAPYAETSFDDYYYTTRFDNSVSLNGKISEKWNVNALTAYNYYNRIKKTLYKDLTTLDENLSPNSSDQDTSSFTLLMSRASFTRKSADSKLNYELGYDVNYESALGKRIDKNLQYMGDYAVFTTAEYKPISQLIIKPGLRYAYNTTYKTPLIPSLNLKWDFTENHTIRASYARGFRAPTIKELYFYFVDINHNIVGNGNLQSEKSNNYSLTYNYRRDLKKCRMKFDAGIFYNDIFNLVTLAQVAGVEYSYVNIGQHKTLGLQLGNTLNFKRLALQLGYNHTGRYNQLSGDNNLPQFNYTPEVLTNVTYKFIKQKATVSLFYKYSGRLPSYALNSNSDVVQTMLNDYNMFDATASKLFWNDRITLTFGCKNIFNVTNIRTTALSGGVHSASSSSMPLSTGRNYFVKLSFNFIGE